jgi:hypothetical protein
MRPVLLKSPFPPEECRRRLEGATEDDTFLANLKLQHGVLIRLSDTGFRLRLRRRFIRNSFSRLLYGTWHETPTGTTLEVRIKLQPTVLVSTILWFGGVTIIGGLGFVLGTLQILTGDQWVAEGSPWFFVLLFPGLMLFGVLLLLSGRGDGDELLDFLESVLEATPAQRGAA